ncbi:hypothetical protein CASFOL_008223 [Castilleja foliolosa]|uniref:Uncharacterized protein n=1 Tax=Castilleja foliolosa TaxID=1961234 RepID=A0ABD3DYC9_9LAMI
MRRYHWAPYDRVNVTCSDKTYRTSQFTQAARPNEITSAEKRASSLWPNEQ